nr:hypothetical protein [Tanacetum cinerariifolium]
MDSNFNNENDPWEFSLDIDDFDLRLTPVLHSSSSTSVEPSPLTPNLVRIIPGPAGIVQQAKLLKEKVFILDSKGALMSTQEYMQKVVEDMGEDEDFNSKACWNCQVLFFECDWDLTVTIKDLSGTIPGTIHYKVISEGGYRKDITVGAAMILVNVFVFTPKPSMHYLDITKKIWLRLKVLNCSYLYVSCGEEYFIIPAHLVSQPYLVYIDPFFILDKLSEVAESPRLVDKIKYIFGRSHSEDESFARLMCDLFLLLKISLSKKRRLIAKLEAVREVEGAVKCLEHMRVIVARDAVTLGELETLLGRAQVRVSLKAGFVADMEVKD